MSPDELNERFALPGVLHFEQAGALVRGQVHLPECAATFYLHGAHLTHWQPAGLEPVLFLSERSEFAEGKPIRGGIPLCFPWFGPRGEGPGPAHGFARLEAWELMFAALLPGDAAAGRSDTLRLTLGLGPGEMSRALGVPDFRAVYEIVLGEDGGRSLTLRLSVANVSQATFKFEEAMHTYFAVGDVREAAVTGLEGARYLDKTDGFREKWAPAEALRLTGQTDRVFPGNRASTVIQDAAGGRRIRVEKRNSATTVVWNPWAEASKTIADLTAEAWERFLCVETANTGADAITLAPGEVHTMEARIQVEAA